MKLAEALILRADLKKRSEQLKQRLKRNAKVQEGDKPPEEPGVLFDEFDRVAAELEAVIRQINWTNANVLIDDLHRIRPPRKIRRTRTALTAGKHKTRYRTLSSRLQTSFNRNHTPLEFPSAACGRNQIEG